jgi:PAS domain-containing protein
VTTDRDGEEAERVQAEIRERLLLATESARIGIWDWDVESGEVLWDRRMFELYGIDKDDSRTAIDAWISVIIPEDREQVDADVAAALEAGSGFHSEYRVFWPDGVRAATSPAQGSSARGTLPTRRTRTRRRS